MMFDETPPGQHPTKISPSPIASGSASALVIPNAKNGIIRYWAIAPTQISKGLFAKILKSCAVNVSPMLNMIIPMIIDWFVNLFATKSTNNILFTHAIIPGTKNVITAIAITTIDV